MAQMFCGVNLKYLAIAEHGGIFLIYRPPASPERDYLLEPKCLNFQALPNRYILRTILV